MTALVTEFTALNDIAFDEVYVQACRYVEQQRPVSVVDSRDAREDEPPVALAMLAAHHPEFREAACAAVLTSLVARQASDTSVSLGIATIGTNGSDEVKELEASIEVKPAGAWRWISSSIDANGLFELLVKWMILIIDRQNLAGSANTTLAEEESREIDDGLLRPSDEAQPFRRYWGPL